MDAQAVKCTDLVIAAPGVDDALSDLDELDPAFLEQSPQQLEGPQVVHAEAFHDDALGPTDAVAGRYRRMQLLPVSRRGYPPSSKTISTLVSSGDDPSVQAIAGYRVV